MKGQQEHELSQKHKLRSAKRSVRFIARNFPQVYQLEREWLDQIASASRFAKPEKSQSRSQAIWIWIAIVILLSTLARLFK